MRVLPGRRICCNDSHVSGLPDSGLMIQADSRWKSTVRTGPVRTMRFRQRTLLGVGGIFAPRLQGPVSLHICKY